MKQEQIHFPIGAAIVDRCLTLQTQLNKIIARMATLGIVVAASFLVHKSTETKKPNHL